MSTRNQKRQAEKEKQRKNTRKEIDELKVTEHKARVSKMKFKYVKIGHNTWNEVAI